MTKKDEKIFAIINSYLVGDMLLVNSLIQNIKKIYKNSKIVMISSSTLADLAKYQEGVDDVVIWNRHGEHKGFFGMLKFIKEFPYRNIYATFPIYAMDRPIILSWLLGSKYVLFGEKKNIFKFLKKEKYKTQIPTGKVQTQHLELLKGITKEKLTDYPIKYTIDKKTISPLADLKDYLVLCPVSSKKIKDMPKETVIDLIKSIDKKVIILGNGIRAKELSIELEYENLENLIDLTDKTTLQQAAKVMNNSDGVISVDTGLMHMAYSLNKPTLGVFYQGEDSAFAPDEKMYNTKSIFKDQTSENILKELKILISKETNNG